MKSYWTTVGRIYNTGVRRFFLLNVPPLQHTPEIKGDRKDRGERWAEYSEYYNQELGKTLEGFKYNHKDATVTIFDLHDLFTRVLKDPKEYTFADNSTIGEDDHIWADNFHLGGRMHELIAKEVAEHLERNGIHI
ncbi:MAG: hypothetical protein M1837_000396 [Sclerophora amabilis]|nr:MAG: hypothetical protein M1837_000396 [Sclerophora amabilis]